MGSGSGCGALPWRVGVETGDGASVAAASCWAGSSLQPPGLLGSGAYLGRPRASTRLSLLPSHPSAASTSPPSRRCPCRPPAPDCSLGWTRAVSGKTSAIASVPGGHRAPAQTFSTRHLFPSSRHRALPWRILPTCRITLAISPVGQLAQRHRQARELPVRSRRLRSPHVSRARHNPSSFGDQPPAPLTHGRCSISGLQFHSPCRSSRVISINHTYKRRRPLEQVRTRAIPPARPRRPCLETGTLTTHRPAPNQSDLPSTIATATHTVTLRVQIPRNSIAQSTIIRSITSSASAACTPVSPHPRQCISTLPMAMLMPTVLPPPTR